MIPGESTRLASARRQFRDCICAIQGGYFIELGMGLCEQVYFDPALVDIIDGVFYYWNELKAKTLKLHPRLAISAPRSSERPKLGHDLREIQSTVSREPHLELKPNLTLMSPQVAPEVDYW